MKYWESSTIELVLEVIDKGMKRMFGNKSVEETDDLM